MGVGASFRGDESQKTTPEEMTWTSWFAAIDHNNEMKNRQWDSLRDNDNDHSKITEGLFYVNSGLCWRHVKGWWQR